MGETTLGDASPLDDYEPLDHAAEMAWLSANTEQLTSYAGRWIAVAGRRVVAAGESLRIVRAMATMKGYLDPLFVPVPPRDAEFR